MKNFFFLFLTLISIKSFAQLTFDKTILECENKWVAFPEDNDGIYKYGFIYIDSQTGITFVYSGNFKINANAKIMAYPLEKTSLMKIPLNPNKIQIAIIPETNFEELKITNVPDSLNFKQMEEGSIEKLYRWGSIYNAWGEHQKALDVLQKAYQMNNEFKGLDIELAYSYNRLNQYKKAIEILKKTVVVNPADAFVNKEYIYALAANQQIETAVDCYKNSLKVCSDKTYVPENAFYILQGYFFRNDFKNFDNWLAETEDVMDTNEQIKNIVEKMKTDIKKNR